MVVGKFEVWLIVIAALGIVIEGPAATSAMHQVPQFILLTSPEAFHAAAFSHCAPFIREELAVLVKRAANSKPRSLLPSGNS
jgi:hypothetical protein